VMLEKMEAKGQRSRWSWGSLFLDFYFIWLFFSPWILHTWL